MENPNYNGSSNNYQYRGSCSVVYNNCYGGFSLSDLGYRCLCERKGISSEETDKYFASRSKYYSINSHHLGGLNVDRDDKDLVAVVLELGDKANGKYAKLTISEKNPPKFWEITEYDGSESVTIDYVEVTREISNILDNSKTAEESIEKMKALFHYLKQFPHFHV